MNSSEDCIGIGRASHDTAATQGLRNIVLYRMR